MPNGYYRVPGVIINAKSLFTLASTCLYFAGLLQYYAMLLHKTLGYS